MSCPGCINNCLTPEGCCTHCGKQLRSAVQSAPAVTLHTLWEQVSAELPPTSTATALALNPLTLRNFAAEREQFELLWKMADDSMQSAGATPLYAELAPPTSQALSSPAIAAALATVEQSSATAHRTTLTGVTPARETGAHRAAHGPLQTSPLVSAPAGARLAAGLFDVGYVVLMALVITFTLFWFLTPELRGELLAPTQFPAPTLISFVGTAVAALIALAFFYPWISGGQTTGQRLFGLETVGAYGGALSARTRILRSLLLPLSALIWPLMPPLWRTLGFHNQLSGAVVIRRVAG
ncbi:MAG: RDD family protein [Proteobacteria bacterium]|nr:RDD family protein [Pseudomonadota bacterium]